MSRVKDDIKNNEYLPVYLLYGEEAYLREDDRKQLLSALVKPGDNLNFSSFSGSGTSAGEVISLARTCPFMAERRVIFVKDSEWFNGACPELLEYLSSPSDSTVLIFDEAKVDKRVQTFKAAVKMSCAIEEAPMKEDRLRRWIAAYCQRQGKKIEDNAVEMLVARVGNDLNKLSLEMDKVISHAGTRGTVLEQDVDQMCLKTPQHRVYDMIDAMAANKRSDAVSIYYDMIMLGENPFGVMSLMEKHFRQLYAMKEMMAANASYGEILKASGIFKSKFRLFQSQAARFTKKQIAGALEDCVRLEQDSKQGRLDASLALEMIISKYSEKEG
ncbi:MAG: DNA polymerase III subunit delta [Lachnospiraceae bacterium]|nr:DNA polymerase III subunit delta [Lachnospiraceae bacterium]